MLAVLSASTMYLSCYGFFHAHEKRTEFDFLLTSERNRKYLRGGSWLLLALSLFISAEIQGWSRGIFTWACLLFLMGFLSLFIQAYKPKWHFSSFIIFAVVTVISAIGAII